MNTINFTNNIQSNSLSSEVNRRLEDKENFTALDKEQLKQDTINLAKNTHEQVKDNFIFRILRNTFGVEDPKKFLISAGLTIITTLSFAALGNKFNKQIIGFSHKIDDFIGNNQLTKNISSKISCAKKGIVDFLNKFNFTKDLIETFTKRKAHPVQSIAITTGPKAQFSNCVNDASQALHLKFHSKDYNDIKKALGDSLFNKNKKRILGFLGELASSKNIKKELSDLYSAKGLDDAEIKKFALKLADIEENYSGFLKKEQGEQLTAEVFEGIKKLIGVDDETASDIFKKLKQITNYESIISTFEKNIGKEKASELLKKLESNDKAFEKSLRNLVGDNDFEYFLNNFMNISNDENRANFARKLTEAIAKKNGCDIKDKKALTEILWKLRSGDLGKEYTSITMNREGFLSSWLPVNIIDSIGSKIFKDKWKPFGKGNLGDTLIKFNMSDGALAQTTAGKLAQKFPLYLGESVSNNVADLATINLLITIPAMMSTFNTTQEAPKEQKVATLANEFVGSLGQFVFSLPLAIGATYGIATLKNLKGNSPLKWLGQIIGMGLPTKLANGQIKQTKSFPLRFLGGAFRLFLVLGIFSPKISKVISTTVQKIFGKPYDANEAAKEKQLQEQRNTVIPELGITQGELNDKIEANPNAIAKLQKDPMLLREIQKDPKKILDILDGKEIQTKPKDKLLSPANLNLTKNTNNKRELFNDKQQVQQEQQVQSEEYKIKDTATYIPSSEFTVKPTLNDIQIQEYQRLMNDSDKILKKAEEYI